MLDGVRSLVREIRLAGTQSQRQQGLSAAQLFVLQVLAQWPDLSINDLAERTSTDQSSVSVVVQKLVHGDYVTKERSREDQRSFRVRLTPKGREVARKAPVAPQQRMLEGLARLPPAKRKQLADLFDDWLDALGLEHHAPPMIGEGSAKRRPR